MSECGLVYHSSSSSKYAKFLSSQLNKFLYNTRIFSLFTNAVLHATRVEFLSLNRIRIEAFLYLICWFIFFHQSGDYIEFVFVFVCFLLFFCFLLFCFCFCFLFFFCFFVFLLIWHRKYQIPAKMSSFFFTKRNINNHHYIAVISFLRKLIFID